MPNWSDDEGRCHFEVNGVPCYQSPVGCPMHEVKRPKRKTKVKLSAYEQCLNALNMTEADQRVEVDGEVLERLLKQHAALRSEVKDLKAEVERLKAQYEPHPTGAQLIQQALNHPAWCRIYDGPLCSCGHAERSKP